MTAEKEVTSETNGQGEQENNDNDDTSKLEDQIIRQVEYYFGDVNLGRDKFLREQVKLADGWVPLEIMIKFNRLAKLSTDIEVIANALNKSTSGLLEVSEDNKKVRRSPEMPVPEMNEERRKDIQGRTVYAKGFPKDSSLDDLLQFFKELGETENVVMRRYLDKSSKTRMFKGSVFATFKTKEDAEKFIANKELKHGETPLLTMWQEEYLQKKQEEYLEKKEKKEKKSKDKEAKKEEKEPLKLPTGTVFHIAQENEQLKREDLHGAFTKLGADIAYIDFKVGDKEGWVRLAKENQGKEIFEKIPDGKLTVGETTVTVKLMEGEDETKYLDKTVEEMIKRRKNQKNFQHKNKGRGKYQNRKRRQDNDGDAPPAKVKADS